MRKKCLLSENPAYGITQTELTEILSRVAPPSAAFLTAGMWLMGCVLVEVLQRDRTNSIYTEEEEEMLRNWLTQLWRPRSPQICHLRARDSGEPVVWTQPESESEDRQPVC